MSDFCKGQGSSEKEQQSPPNLRRSTEKQASRCPWSSFKEQNSEWVRYFLLSQSEETMPPFCLKGQSEIKLCSLRQNSLVTFGLYASWWVMSQKLHKTISDETWLTFLLWARTLQFRDTIGWMWQQLINMNYFAFYDMQEPCSLASYVSCVT